jgi:hypothetical protein
MIYENENDNEVMEVLAQAIGKKNNLPYLPKFHDSLRSKKSGVRIKAVLVIQRFGDVSSQGKLRMLYENPPSPLTKEERVLLSQILTDEINH